MMTEAKLAEPGPLNELQPATASVSNEPRNGVEMKRANRDDIDIWVTWVTWLHGLHGCAVVTMQRQRSKNVRCNYVTVYKGCGLGQQNNLRFGLGAGDKRNRAGQLEAQ